MRIKTPPQPLVFQYEDATALCGAVENIYQLSPDVPSTLCRWQGKYFLRVNAKLGLRRQLAEVVKGYGDCLGICPVLFAFCLEHGEEISQDAVVQLGGALAKRKIRGNPEKS